MKGKLKLITDKIKTENKIKKRVKIVLFLLIFFILLLYIVLGIFYNKGNFSITLDKNLYYSRGLVVYENPDNKDYKAKLMASEPLRFTNILGKWLPDDINSNMGGSHNGKNYLAYTFFVENTGSENSDYWNEIVIDNVTRNVDEAVRIRVYKNDSFVTYAKKSRNGNPEPGTVAFESDKVVARNYVSDFKPGSLNKYTIVIWLEGPDPECTDYILDGKFQVHMRFNSTYVEKGVKE